MIGELRETELRNGGEHVVGGLGEGEGGRTRGGRGRAAGGGKGEIWWEAVEQEGEGVRGVGSGEEVVAVVVVGMSRRSWRRR